MYKVKQYVDVIASKDKDAQYQFDLIKKLSNNFTEKNTTALQMDELLSQLLTDNEPVQEPKPALKVSAPNIKTKRSKNDLEQLFNDLFESLKNHEPGNISLDDETVNKLIKDALGKRKIRFEDLDSEVKEKFNSLPQIVHYKIPASPTKPMQKPDIPVFQTIVDDVIMGNNVMLIGGAGTGKTFLAERLLSQQALGRDYLTINCSQWTSPVEIIGGQTMDGYQEGKLIEAWKNGFVLILDELPKIDPNTAGLLNDALAKTKISNSVIFNSRRESFTKHPEFACIATGNVYPDKESIAYGANNKQDLSLLDRFSGSVYFIEKNPAIEKQILQNDMIWSICDKLRSVIEELKYEAQLSLRFMQNARDTYNLEMHRIKDKGKEGIKANEGKTFKSAFDSYLSTFTEVQQKNLKEKIRYNEIFSGYHYRNANKDNSFF